MSLQRVHRSAGGKQFASELTNLGNYLPALALGDHLAGDLVRAQMKYAAMNAPHGSAVDQAALRSFERAKRCYTKAGRKPEREQVVSDVRARHHRKHGPCPGSSESRTESVGTTSRRSSNGPRRAGSARNRTRDASPNGVDYAAASAVQRRYAASSRDVSVSASTSTSSGAISSLRRPAGDEFASAVASARRGRTSTASPTTVPGQGSWRAHRARSRSPSVARPRRWQSPVTSSISRSSSRAVWRAGLTSFEGRVRRPG